jgi:hypothetical protein
MGRKPNIEFTEEDYYTAYSLARLGATNYEIGTILRLSESQFNRLVGIDAVLVEALDVGRAEADVELRKLQWKSAQAGSAQMLKFLGANLLGQSEKKEVVKQETEKVVIRLDYE